MIRKLVSLLTKFFSSREKQLNLSFGAAIFEVGPDGIERLVEEVPVERIQ